jgi:hypothetical protein
MVCPPHSQNRADYAGAAGGDHQGIGGGGAADYSRGAGVLAGRIFEAVIRCLPLPVGGAR